MSQEDDDEPVELSAHALSALQEFYQEQISRSDNDDGEDWQLSQFWYDDATARKIADECLRLASENGTIACVSCPTVFKTILDDDRGTPAKPVLFEYDKRFERFGDSFVFFDYSYPQAVFDADRENLRHHFDVVVADPPFLSEECAKNTAETVRELVKMKTGKIIFCTGYIMEPVVHRAIDNLRTCEHFIPQHKCKLGNEFRCYVNYDDAFP